MENFELYQRAIKNWGITAQMDMMIEECSELIGAIEKFRRGRVGVEEVVTEIADVEIMAEQMRLVFGFDYVVEEKARKLQRLQERLDAWEKKNDCAEGV